MPSPLVISGRFIISNLENALIGAGSMGAVYRGVDLKTDESIAVKILDPVFMSDYADIVARFIREGELLHQLEHPNIVKIIDAIVDGDNYYLIMPYISGGSLRDLISHQGQASEELVIQIGLELADALAHTHHLQIIHRDLKPENILLSQNGRPLLSDFGVALPIFDARLTQQDMMVGTPLYLSPEAWNGETLDTRTDLWSLGIIFYELLSGQHPFANLTLPETITAITKKPIPELREKRPELDPNLANLVHCLLIKNRDRRISSARVVGASLEAIQKGGYIPQPYDQDLLLAYPSFQIPSVESNIEKNILPALQQMMCDYFNGNELRDLCFELDQSLSYDDDLAGDTIRSKVRELLLYAERNNALPQLIKICKKNRPKIDWPVSVVQNFSLNTVSDNLVSEWQPICYQHPGIVENPRRFFGREALIKQVNEYIDVGKTVLLCGLGGIGKTALAAHIADKRLQKSQGKVIWLKPGNDDVNTVFEALLRRFATPEEHRLAGGTKGSAKIKVMRSCMFRLADNLFVVDDVRNAQALKALIEILPESTPVLATSRERIALDKIISVGKLSIESSVNLLAFHAGDQNLNDDPDAYSLCKVLGAHPYAIKIAGYILKVDEITPKELQNQKAFYNLKMPGDYDDDGRDGVKAILDESFEGLSKNGQKVFLSIGDTYTGGATAELLTLYFDGNETLTQEGLRELRRRSLIERRNGLAGFSNNNHKIYYYYLHDLAYSYARSRRFPEEKTSLLFLNAILRYVIEQSQRENGLDYLFCEQGNIYHALDNPQQKDIDPLIDIVQVLVMRGYFDKYGYTTKFQDLIISSLQAIHRRYGASEFQHYLFGKLGNSYFDQGNYDKSFTAYQYAFNLAPNSDRRIILLAVMGKVKILAGDVNQGQSFFQQATLLAEKSKNVSRKHFILQQQAVTYGLLKDYDTARIFAKEGIALLQPLGDRIGEGYFKLNLGSIALDADQDVKEALNYHQQVFTIAQEENDLVLKAYALYALGQDYRALQIIDKQDDCLHQAKDIFHQLGFTAMENEVIAYIQSDNQVLIANREGS